MELQPGPWATLPYDLLQAGRKLSFNLGDIFPNLSYPVVCALDRGDMDALFEAQDRHAPGQLGDNATKEFVLRHVFGIAPELIKQQSDLLRVLLRRHYKGQRIPVILDERFIQLLQENSTFDDWPLESLVPDREAFFAFLQERWPIFLDREAAKASSGVKEEYGERETASRAARRVLRSFIDWGVLNETHDKGVYDQGKQYLVEEPRLIAWMVEASLRARSNGSAAIKDLLDSPSIFPFRLAHVSAEHVASLSPRLDILRHGLDDDLVMLREEERTESPIGSHGRNA